MHAFPGRVRALSIAAAAAMTLAAASAGAAPVLDAANGHYYDAILVPTGLTWGAAAAAATAAGGHLATPMNAAENAFVFALVDSSAYFTSVSVNGDIVGPWLGIYSNAAANQSFLYVTGGAVGAYQPWGPGQPDGFGGGAQGITFYAGSSRGSTWGDQPQNGVAGFTLPQGYVIEYATNPLAVPEPASWALMLLAVGCGVASRARRQKS